MNLVPMHSWHPMVIHFPLVALLLAVLFDALAAWRQGSRWREGATLLWWVGLVGAAAAITTGLLAYGRVDHSDPAHEIMTLHRNLAFAATAVLLASAVWRWRRPYSRVAAGLGVVGALGLGGVGYLGGELVFRHALGISTEVLKQVRSERVGYDEEEIKPAAMPRDTAASATRDSTKPATKPRTHTHAPGKEHDD